MEREPLLKTVYSFNPVDGEFTGETFAQEDPLAPGTFLMPPNSTEEAPPAAEEGKKRVYSNGQWSKVTIVIPPEQLPTLQELAFKARAQRNSLLYQCDFTQLPDVPASITSNLAAWQTYRQALRDVPQQVNFPTEINWPEKPQ